ncbi:hypothetical protein ACIBP6_28115 [Nonomuraea terrae]|uniref:hypothetical protein n=1 Tax=Nonomuraea terrae TaxID=2530383 RepID=UPI003787C857
MITADWETVSEAEPRGAALDRLVAQAVKGVADDDAQWCANSFFHRSIKPFVRDYVGWLRGYPRSEARPLSERGWAPVSLDDYFNGDEKKLRRPATNEFEEMLRTSEAYHVVYQLMYRQLPDCRDCMCVRM